MLRPTSLFFLSLAGANAYIWPSPMLDALESARFNQDGHNSDPVSIFITPCTRYLLDPDLDSTTGRSDIADWVRTAYHDMATYNITDGTGGMDASIRFPAENLRPENVGDGFNNTIEALGELVTRYISMADSLALGTIIAIENCGGPEIAFRGGRIDAGGPNTPGVPQPQDDLDSHITDFARQGFTQTEMIGLVACGHTFGGVQQAPFPNIVPVLNDPNNTQSVTHFDSTSVNFDNLIATEYISGTTQNPLVAGSNDTTNSDKRIFGSDGNVTMKSFADSPELFASTCANLIARMLDTVPKGVELTDIITPLPVKPYGVVLSMSGDILKLSGELWNMTADAQRTVNLLWDDHIGGGGNVTMPASGVSTGAGGRYNAAWYSFAPLPVDGPTFLSLDTAAGITNMRFVVDGKLEDQGGVGFAIQDGVVFSETSCYTSNLPPTPEWRIDVAVRNGLNPTRVYLEQIGVTDSVGRVIVPQTDIVPPAQSVPLNANYSLWTVNVTGENFYSIGFEVDDITFSESDSHSIFSFSPCTT
ncbi:Peroxidase [Mycena sanguinolenta]|uniref:Peroxidase n=1 Tax=Mycena sanguinolenta TaxID=230812 RepID=A0A8H6ZAT8_9AGAR|nr:Peroxidase [Mycena sanguinolenta]